MITLTLEIPDEYVEVMTDLGYDPQGYFQMILEDLGKRYRVKIENQLKESTVEVVDEIVSQPESEAQVNQESI